MKKRHNQSYFLQRWLVGVLGVVSLMVIGAWWQQPGGSLVAEATPPAIARWQASEPPFFLQDGLNRAAAAAALTQAATSAEQWDQAAQAWLGAIASLQAIPAESPVRPFAQRQIRAYQQQLAAAQRQAEAISLPYSIPSLGSPVLDEQLILYLSYVAAMGPPDILIVGSSRALQGLDPQSLQQALAARGYPGLRIFNLSVNGATVQVLNFILQRLLTPAQLPKLILWGGGSRAFNSARVDLTFANILESPGYQAVMTGVQPTLDPSRPAVAQPSAIDAYGFLPVASVFDPDIYYQRFPRVSGRYDGFYRPFALAGLQTVSLESLVSFVNAQKIGLIFVNLPLSGDYLDDFRLSYESQFRQFLQTQGRRLGFGVIDWLTQWTAQPAYFADPSHLNQVGAALLSQQLANQPQFLQALQTAGLLEATPPPG
jgi:hypothetical protein